MQDRKDEIWDMMKTEQGQKFVENACASKRKRGAMTILDPKDDKCDICGSSIREDEQSIAFFESQAKAIEDILYGSDYNKVICTEFIGRLHGSVSYAFYFGYILSETFYKWDIKIKDYRRLNMDR